jgi:hypothetical protein
MKRTHRQGDLLFTELLELPQQYRARMDLVLSVGASPSGGHRVTRGSAILYSLTPFKLFGMALLVSSETATVEHAHHPSLELPRGLYDVQPQREYDPKLSDSPHD